MKNVAFLDLPASAYPIVFTVYKDGTDEIVAELTVTEPGHVSIAPLVRGLGYAVRVRARYADGITTDTSP